MKKIKIGNAVLCEHVLQSQHNKHVLVNTYSGDIVVEKIPTQLTLGIYIEIELPGITTSKFELETLYAKNKIAQASGELKFPKPESRGVLVIPVFTFDVKIDGYLEIYVSVEGFARTQAIKKHVLQGKIPVFSVTQVQTTL